MKFIFFKILFLTIVFLAGCTHKNEMLMNISLNNKKDESLFVYNCNDKIAKHTIKTNNEHIKIEICIVENNMLSMNLKSGRTSIQNNSLAIGNCEEKKKFIYNNFYLCKLNDEVIKLGLN